MSNGTASRTLTREELYDLVWKNPINRLAKSYGLSDTGLAKLCDQHDVPRPPVGYWSMMAFGKTVRRPALPPCQDVTLATIALDPVGRSERRYASCKPKPLLSSTFFDPEIGSLADREAGDYERIRPSATLHSPHQLVKRTLEGLIAATKERQFPNEPILWPQGVNERNCLDVHVSKDQIHRALRIMDALVKGLERRGYTVTVPAKQWHRGTIIAGFGDTYQLRMREPKLRQAHVPSAEERERLKRNPNTSLLDQYDYVASGRLQLDLFHEDGHFALKTFREGSKRKLEEVVADVPIAILRVIDHYRHRAVINAEEARKRKAIEQERREREERQRREEQRRKEEQQRIEALFVEAEQWMRCRTLREYLNAVRIAANERLGFIEEESELNQWLKWGDSIVEGHDLVVRPGRDFIPSRPAHISASPRHPR